MERQRSHHILNRALTLALIVGLSDASRGQQATPASAGAAAPPPGPTVTIQPSGDLIPWPINRPMSRRSGLSLLLDTRWTGNYGYRPVTVTIQSPRAVTQNRLILIRITAGSRSWRQGTVQVEKEFELPQGASSASVKLSIPQYFAQSNQPLMWDVFVDGVRDRDLSNDGSANMFVLNIGAADPRRTILVIDSGQSAKQNLVSSSADFELFYLQPPDLPTSWIDYTSVDVISLSVTELKKLKNSKPKALAAIRDWTIAGGQLWIFGAGDSWEQLAEIEKALKPSLSAGDNGEESTSLTDEQAAKRGWAPQVDINADGTVEVVTFRDVNTNNVQVVRDPAVIESLRRSGQYEVMEVSNESSGTNSITRNATSAKWFIEHDLGAGLVRAFRSDQLLNNWAKSTKITAGGVIGPNGVFVPGANTQNIVSVSDPELSAALLQTRSWQARHGLSPEAPNPDFGNWLVPGVGLAPVTAFRVLITLFVLVIGPLNYLLLKRVHRLHLLVVTVPLAACALTGALFAYALASDGLSTTVRIRSFTLLDQRQGEAATWARLSYYAGLAPGQGLLMPSDTAVYPIIPSEYSGDAVTELLTERELIWDENQARMTRGWLRSRRPTQYLTVRAAKTDMRLQVALGQEKVRVKNDLGAEIIYVTVVDPNGGLYGGENIAPGATIDLAPNKFPNIAHKWRTLDLEHAPAPPAELDDISRARQFALSRRGYYFGYASGSESTPLSENTQSLLIRHWTTFLEDPTPNWRRRTYVAVVKTNPQVATGLESYEEEASYHVIGGHW
jgi:hypothetical protein